MVANAARTQESFFMALSPIVVARGENDWAIATFRKLPWNFLEWMFSQVACSERCSDEQPLLALEEFAEERRRFIRDSDDLVRCLTIEFEIELGPGPAVIPVGEVFELALPQRLLRERGASDGEAQTRRLPGDAVLLRDRSGESDNAARDEASPALVLAREHENRVAFGDMPAAIHRLLRGERERLRPRIANLGFDRERHASPLPRQMSIAIIPGRPPDARLCRAPHHEGLRHGQDEPGHDEFRYSF